MFSEYKSKAMLDYFLEITKIPRPSYKEDKIAEYLCEFAQKRGLEYSVDSKYNVLIKKPGTEGRENEGAVLLQGHTDMVCECDEGILWDCEREGVKTEIDGDFIHALGTTLGGDDGAAVAAMLAILDGALDSHPPIECLFTTCEEVGLDGAKAFDMKKISARRMINLDSESEGEAIISCAGGVRTDIIMKAETCSFENIPLKITVSGLCGGHSGADIHLGRANANKLLAQALSVLLADEGNNLVSFWGGSKDNAITRSAEAVISVKDAESVKETLKSVKADIMSTLSEEDSAEFGISCEACDIPEYMLAHASGVSFVELILRLPFGVIEWINETSGEVESSANIGIVKTEGEELRVAVSSRSNDEGKLDAIEKSLGDIATEFGCSFAHRSRYPGWKNAGKSRVEALYTESYEELFGVRPLIHAIHAGLECGIFKAAIPDMDIISIGPSIIDIHTPRERMSLSSCDKFWQVLCRMLADRI